MNTAPILEVENLKKYFKITKKDTLKAVDGVSFRVEEGTTLGLVGESGCGKTTVGRTIMRIYEPDGGKILYRGQDISKLSPKDSTAFCRKIQMVFQDPYASLNPFFTVGEIIGEGMDIQHLYTGKKERLEKIHELLELVGLRKEYINRFPYEFSGGQRQRVGIARALALEPEFIICDEAISALDVSIQAQVVNLLIRLRDEMNLSYLFIAHDLSMVRHISDTAAVMYLGCMVEYGDTDEVYSHAAHPYTQGLLSSVPVADPNYERSHERIHMDGEIPSPINPKPGCRFASRCRYASERCQCETPVLKEIAPKHYCACHMV